MQQPVRARGVEVDASEEIGVQVIDTRIQDADANRREPSFPAAHAASAWIARMFHWRRKKKELAGLVGLATSMSGMSAEATSVSI